MFSTLAAATTSGNSAPSEVMPSLFSRMDNLAHPDALVSILQQLSMVWAGIFVAVGLVCLLRGFKMYKAVVIITSLLLGIAMGYNMGKHIQSEVIVAGCTGVLLAVIAWPFMKYAVSIYGGLAGAVIGANAWTALGHQLATSNSPAAMDSGNCWAGALMGLILFGMLSFIVFDWSVVMFTSFGGSMLAVLGCISFLLQITAWRSSIANSLQANPLVVPLLVIVPAVVGLVLQHQLGGLKKSGGSGPSPTPALAGAKK